MFRRISLSIAAAIFTLALSSVARADEIQIVGNSTGSLSTATVNCVFNSATNTFTFTVTNTSPFDARITGIGFDIGPGNISGFSGGNVAGFTFSDGNLGNVPQFNSANLDFGWTTGNSGNFNGGSPNNGLAPGNSLTFTVSGAAFAGMTEEQICNAIFLRFQRVGANGEGSDVGRPGGPNEPVPEPATLLLLGTGVAGVAARIRRRRNKAQGAESDEV
ncbi:MAG TPA: cistern family PEP-CTERM protein [Pyrinomonadaceae bacterium]|nr:cistern family PEP-CTERM protein [Pyrinomonadaceae bacterium]